MGSWEWDVATDEWKWDAGQYRIFGLDPQNFRVTPENIRQLIHPDDAERTQGMIQNMSEGARTQQIEFRVLRTNGEQRWCIGTAAASFDADSRLVRISGVTVDITDRKEAEERQVLLAREVDHRARNALAVIQSIIRLTRAKSVDDYVMAIEGRIKALARAHTLLSDSRWHSADLAKLVAEELAPYRVGDKVAIHGPDISLQPSTAQGLALALHELATNAAKYGALSSMTGKVNLKWQLQRDGLKLRWEEHDGPPTVAPLVHSFGLKVIQSSIEQQLGGEVTFEWNPKGLRCDLSIPHGELMRPRIANGTPGGSATSDLAIRSNSERRLRVLLVEDEALVAMMIQDSLLECGFEIVGPISRASDAVVAAAGSHFDAAVLDVNLGDGLVYAVADVLAERGVPFVFVTGYDADSIDTRFSDIPVLQKPIEREVLQKIFVQGSQRSAAISARDKHRARA
jgi:PAS domain S-box-containing protein